MTKDDAELMARLVAFAKARADGHLTVMRFTTNWRVAFTTIEDRFEIDAMPVGKTFAEAAHAALRAVGENP
jgi:hypothetical protein